MPSKHTLDSLAGHIDETYSVVQLNEERLDKLETGFAALAVSNHAMTQAITDLSAFLESRKNGEQL